MNKEMLELLDAFARRIEGNIDETHNVVIDGGFFRGHFSSEWVERHAGFQCYGFEPNPAMYREWIEKKHPAHGIFLTNSALTKQNDRRQFHLSSKYPATNSLLPRPVAQDGAPYYPAEAIFDAAVEVSTVSLDAFCDDRGIMSIFLMKLDLQGGEMEALRGAEILLREERVALILTEAVFVSKYEGQPLMIELWHFLLQHGYRLHSLHDIKSGDYDGSICPIRNRQLNQCDVLFVGPKIARLYD